MTLKVDHGVPVPADAKAVIVAQNLVAARYVQLTPAYRTGGGPTMRDGAVIGSDRTAVPVEWDEVKTQLMRLSTELGPQTGVSGTSVSRFIDSAANALDGNGDKLRQTLSQLSGVARVFAEGSGNIVDIIKNLQTFVTALRDSKQQIVMFQNRLASLTSVINDSRSDLDAALSDLSVAIGEVQRFVAGSRDQTAEQIQRLGSLTQVLVDNKTGLRERSAHHAQRDRQLQQHLLPERRCGDRGILAGQLLESGLCRLRHDRRRREHHRTRNRETLCAVPRVPRCGCSTSTASRCRSTRICGLPSIRTGSSTPTRSWCPGARGRVTRLSRRRRCRLTPAWATSRRPPAGTGPARLRRDIQPPTTTRPLFRRLR